MSKYLPRFTKFSLQKKNGFTLIELMVVVTIIAILAVVGMVAFTNVQAQSRDGRRRADIDAIATAMETNRTGAPGQEVYPSYSGTIFANGVKPCDPVDPTPSTCGSSGTQISYGGIDGLGYRVNVGTGVTSTFIACAMLEKGNGNSSSGTSIDTTGTLSYYCKKNQQ